jgi:hypothetical protein
MPLMSATTINDTAGCALLRRSRSVPMMNRGITIISVTLSSINCTHGS